jgi:hypothetical protein
MYLHIKRHEVKAYTTFTQIGIHNVPPIYKASYIHLVAPTDSVVFYPPKGHTSWTLQRFVKIQACFHECNKD